MSVTEIKYKSGRVLRIIDGEYVIGAGGSCNNKVLCPKKVFNGYVVRKCGSSGSDNELDCSGGCIYDKYYDDNRKEIYIVNEDLGEIDRCIGCYEDLQVLLLYMDNITSLPNEIGNLSSLIYLSLNSNNLTSLPNEIGNLSSLNNLVLTNNNLTSLPNEIGNLDNSEIRVDLSNNNFTDDYKEHIKNDLFPIANENGNLYL